MAQSVNNRGVASSKAIVPVNTSTGEIMIPDREEEVPDQIIAQGTEAGTVLALLLREYESNMFPGSLLPANVAALDAMPLNDMEKGALLDEYSQDSMTLKDFLKKHGPGDYLVYGMSIDFHPPYRGKDGEDKPGYYVPLMLLKDKKGELQLVRTSSLRLSKQMFYSIRRNGWWLFQNKKGEYEPKTYRFYSGMNDSLFMHEVWEEDDSPLQKLLKGGKG